MREFCEYVDSHLSDLPDSVIENCVFMPDSCTCIDCPYFTLKVYPIEL